MRPRLRHTAFFLSLILVFTGHVLCAGPLAEDYSTECASALAGTLTAQAVLIPRQVHSPILTALVPSPSSYMNRAGPLSAGLAYVNSESPQIHIQAAAKLLATIDAMPGSYSHAKAISPFSSVGDGSRPANPLFKKVLYELTRAKQLGVPPESALRTIYTPARVDIPWPLQQERLTGWLKNLKAVEELGLDTPEGLELMKKGGGPNVTKGAQRYVGKRAEVDHTVARSVAPQFENEVANLQILPEALNGSKLANHGPFEEQHRARLTRLYGRSTTVIRYASGTIGGAAVGTGLTILLSKNGGDAIDWASVGKSATIGAGSGAATMLGSQLIEKQFGNQLAKSMIARNLLPGASKSLARCVLSTGIASAGVSTVIMLGFVAKDYYSGDISTTDALVQSGVGLGSAGTGVGAGLILAYATTGTLLGTEVPLFGNAAGFVGGAVIGTAVYIGGNWYYENFKAERDLAEMKAFKQTAAKWDAAKLDQEISQLKDKAQSLRAEAARLLRPPVF